MKVSNYILKNEEILKDFENSASYDSLKKLVFNNDFSSLPLKSRSQVISLLFSYLPNSDQTEFIQNTIISDTNELDLVESRTFISFKLDDWDNSVSHSPAFYKSYKTGKNETLIVSISNDFEIDTDTKQFLVMLAEKISIVLGEDDDLPF